METKITDIYEQQTLGKIVPEDSGNYKIKDPSETIGTINNEGAVYNDNDEKIGFVRKSDHRVFNIYDTPQGTYSGDSIRDTNDKPLAKIRGDLKDEAAAAYLLLLRDNSQ